MTPVEKNVLFRKDTELFLAAIANSSEPSVKLKPTAAEYNRQYLTKAQATDAN